MVKLKHDLNISFANNFSEIGNKNTHQQFLINNITFQTLEKLLESLHATTIIRMKLEKIFIETELKKVKLFIYHEFVKDPFQLN